jgi:hypothetical protein
MVPGDGESRQEREKVGDRSGSPKSSRPSSEKEKSNLSRLNPKDDKMGEWMGGTVQKKWEDYRGEEGQTVK